MKQQRSIKEWDKIAPKQYERQLHVKENDCYKLLLLKLVIHATESLSFSQIPFLRLKKKKNHCM